MKQWIDKLRQERTLRPEEFRQLLTGCDADSLRIINEQAREVSLRHFGNRIYIRGLIEISNCCRNNCYYCGIRKGNPHVARYRLSPESILDCCKQGYALGFRTFVLQGGEDPALTDDRIETIVARIRQEYPDCAITLSLGEKSREAYERFFRAGANRYLLRHETYNESPAGSDVCVLSFSAAACGLPCDISAINCGMFMFTGHAVLQRGFGHCRQRLASSIAISRVIP